MKRLLRCILILTSLWADLELGISFTGILCRMGDEYPLCFDVFRRHIQCFLWLSMFDTGLRSRTLRCLARRAAIFAAIAASFGDNVCAPGRASLWSWVDCHRCDGDGISTKVLRSEPGCTAGGCDARMTPPTEGGVCQCVYYLR